MKNINLFILLIVPFFMLSCEKDDMPLQEGTYEGTFTVSYRSGSSAGGVTLILEDGRYYCFGKEGNPYRTPAGGSGRYYIDGNKIVFSDENVWTAEFDWNLILNGKYDYTAKGSTLVIASSKNDVGYYKYILKKK